MTHPPAAAAGPAPLPEAAAVTPARAGARRRRPAGPPGEGEIASAPPADGGRPARATPDRILDAALALFGGRGFEASSLDHVAAELGVRKQTILYYFPSKTELLDAVIDRSAGELAVAFEAAVARAPGGFARVEALVRSVFRLALRRPELLGLVREVARLGAPASPRLIANLEPLVQRAQRFLEQEMEEGRFRQCDARLLLLSVYSTVLGVATEAEVLRAVGIEPTLRSTAVRRRELVSFLRRALVADDESQPSSP